MQTDWQQTDPTARWPPSQVQCKQTPKKENQIIPLTGTATAAMAIALPGPLPTAPPIACHPGALANPISTPLHTGTPRTLYRWSQLMASPLAVRMKARSTWRALPMGRLHSIPAFSSLSHNGMKGMTVKIDPGAQVNTIPMSKYHLLFPKKLTKSKFPKAKALLPTSHTWISPDDSPKPFLGHFITEVMHASEPRLYPTCFYVFEDATSPPYPTFLHYIGDIRCCCIQSP